MAKQMETFMGDHIRDCVLNAVKLAHASRTTVTFEFNGLTYTIVPSDSYETARAKAEAIAGFPILSAEDEQAKAKADLDRIAHEQATAIQSANVPTEAQLREADVPWPKSDAELVAYIAQLVNRPHDYGTCVYAMSMAAVAAFRYVASALGVTGFQASCADMDILRRTRSLKGPFMFITGEDLLYPQHDPHEKLDEFIEKNREWCATEARRELAGAKQHVHPDVIAHWQRLATK